MYMKTGILIAFRRYCLFEILKIEMAKKFLNGTEAFRSVSSLKIFEKKKLLMFTIIEDAFVGLYLIIRRM